MAVRTTVRVNTVTDAVSPPGEPMVAVKAASDPLDDVTVSVLWTCPAGLAPRHGDRYVVRVDWVDPVAEEEIGVVLADEATAWILSHRDSTVRILQQTDG